MRKNSGNGLLEWFNSRFKRISDGGSYITREQFVGNFKDKEVRELTVR